jgi:SAM-dependent methyltransferase
MDRRYRIFGARTEPHSAPYDRVAGEYYDVTRHPTSANFRQATILVMRKWLLALGGWDGWTAEIGSGKSILAEVLDPSQGLSRLVLLDSSAKMLRYSLDSRKRGARLVQGSAEAIPFPSGSLRRLVAPLGDPYNSSEFWAEVRRVLSPGGEALFTTPSYEWASTFRGTLAMSDLAEAEFTLRNGELVNMPSCVLPPEEQVEMITCAGLVVERREETQLRALSVGPISQKLVTERGGELNILTSYFVRR